VLTQSAPLADYFEETARAAKNAKAASNWIMGELLRTLKERGQEIGDVPMQPPALAGLIALIERGTISTSVAKGVFATMYDSGRSADDIVREEGLAQNSDEGALSAIVAEVLSLNDDAAAQYRAGKKQTFGFLVGQVMKKSGGKANPKLASDLVKRALES
jgi:aspartyl-tRNA(Asn)/glutamyl-tRNA(Gln) amidotransferase subunit B